MSPTTRTRSRSTALLSLPVLLGSVGGCGVPAGGEARVIDPSAVPYRLLDRVEPSPTDGPIAAPANAPRLYWTDPEQRLVARSPAQYCVSTLPKLVEEILAQLAAGPPGTDRAAGLGSALPPQQWVDLAELDGDLAVLRVAADTAIGTNRVAVAAAQVVLSVTSIAGISRVELVREGDTLRVPLPDGELASGPLTAAAYAGALAHPSLAPTPGASEWSDIRCPSGGSSVDSLH